LSTSTSEAKRKSLGAIPDSLATLYDRRWLIWYFAQRQLSRSYRASYLGFLWLILGPVLMIVLFTLIFSEVIGLRFRETDSVANFGLYLYCGLIPFLAFAAALNNSVSSIRSNSSLVQKVVFPLEILPFTSALTSFVGQLFGFGTLIVIVAAVEQQLHWTIALLPMILFPQILFTLGLSYLAAVAGTYLPDLKEALAAFVRMMFFATPIAWPPERVPEYLRFVVDYNPLAFLVVAYRDLILEGEIPGATPTLFFTLFSAILAIGSFALFLRYKRRFPDLI
jgi:ABC-2 type transport system permease protein